MSTEAKNIVAAEQALIQRVTGVATSAFFERARQNFVAAQARAQQAEAAMLAAWDEYVREARQLAQELDPTTETYAGSARCATCSADEVTGCYCPKP